MAGVPADRRRAVVERCGLDRDAEGRQRVTDHRGKSQDRLLQTAGLKLCEKIRGALAARERVNLAVPGGRSVAKIFQVMQREPLDWQRVHFFIIDERLVPVDHPDSNYKLLQDNFITPLAQAGRIAPGNAHPFILDPASAHRGAKRYENVLVEYGFRYDIILLTPARTATWAHCTRTIILSKTGTTASS